MSPAESRPPRPEGRLSLAAQLLLALVALGAALLAVPAMGAAPARDGGGEAATRSSDDVLQQEARRACRQLLAEEPEGRVDGYRAMSESEIALRYADEHGDDATWATLFQGCREGVAIWADGPGAAALPNT